MQLQSLRMACATICLTLSASNQANPAAYLNDARTFNLAHGRVVFEQKCMTCHESGRHGAPILGDPEEWRDRLEQPLQTLIDHAIRGHGRMPPRGDQDITDQDVAAAVAFVVDRTRKLIVEDPGSLPSPATGPESASVTPSPDDAVVRMFLLLYGKERWR